MQCTGLFSSVCYQIDDSSNIFNSSDDSTDFKTIQVIDMKWSNEMNWVLHKFEYIKNNHQGIIAIHHID